MSFRTATRKEKPQPVAAAASVPAGYVPKDDRKKATVRFTRTQWKQLRDYLHAEETTLQALIVGALADKLTTFDV